jgi:steroid delta-isomerase-like uncharacterized protein
MSSAAAAAERSEDRLEAALRSTVLDDAVPFQSTACRSKESVMPTERDENDATNDLTPTEQRNLAAFSGVFPHWNHRDIPRMLTFYNDDIVWRNVAMQETYRGKEEVRAFLAQLFRALPDLELDVTLRIARGKYVAEEYVIRGTHLGPFYGIPPTGKRLAIPAMSMVEMRDGKLQEDHFYYDAASVLRQMGMLPPVAAVNTPLGRMMLQLLVHRVWVAQGVAVASIVALALFGRRRSRSIERTS